MIFEVFLFPQRARHSALSSPDVKINPLRLLVGRYSKKMEKQRKALRAFLCAYNGL